MDIEFFDPKEADFHGVRTLVQNLLGGAEFDASQLADAIITQVPLLVIFMYFSTDSHIQFNPIHTACFTL